MRDRRGPAERWTHGNVTEQNITPRTSRGSMTATTGPHQFGHSQCPHETASAEDAIANVEGSIARTSYRLTLASSPLPG